MKNLANVIFIICIAVTVLIVSGGVYTVDETEQVIITQFGELIGEPKTEAGLYFKMPFLQTANYFEKRILEWNGDPNQIPTLDKRFIWVDVTARWRIADPLKFMRSMRTENSAQARLDDILDAATREIISNHMLIEAIRDSNRLLQDPETLKENQWGGLGGTAIESIKDGREALSRKILERAEKVINDFGIDLLDVRIKRINYIKEVRQKVYDRMISERKRAAEQFRSEGQGKKAEIEGEMQKDLQEIRSGAYRTAQEVKGKADAEAIKIYAEAYNNDPEFYSFLRTLESYRKSINKDTTLILSTDNDFFRYFNTIQPAKSIP